MVSILVQVSVAALGIALLPLHDMEHMLDFGRDLGLGRIVLSVQVAEGPMTATPFSG